VAQSVDGRPKVQAVAAVPAIIAPVNPPEPTEAEAKQRLRIGGFWRARPSSLRAAGRRRLGETADGAAGRIEKALPRKLFMERAPRIMSSVTAEPNPG
jgi:hypothetical protein